MTWFIVKVLITAIIIVIVSEVGKVNAFLGSMLASIPLVSTLGMIWMQAEKTPADKIVAHSRGVFWMVLPSLPMFLLLPWLLEKQRWSFSASLATSLALTVVLYFGSASLLKRYGILI
jgi:F0F1-type ATP synthase assembly protein I